MARKPVNIAVIGCGVISRIYLKNLTERFSAVRVVGCADLIPERSAARAEAFGIRQMTDEEIWNDTDIQIVVNLTYPDAHYEVTKRSLLSGKHVYCEKMMAKRFEEGAELVSLAREKGLMYCVAPDTFLGGGFQTVRKYIDAGMIGRVFHANALVVRGYQHTWEAAEPYMPFILTPGGGIPYDMGGYYLHAMIHTLGSLRRVCGFAKTFCRENVRWNPRHEAYGLDVGLDTPTLMSASLEFESGAYGTLTTASDGFGETARLEFYGTEGTLIAHDPNLYGESIFLVSKSDASGGKREVPFTHGYVHGNYRGLAIADMAWALRNRRPPRLDCALGLHALEAVSGIRNSCENNRVYDMTTHCQRPRPMPSGFFSDNAAEASMDNAMERYL